MNSTEDPSPDALIIGAGFAGLYMLHRLRQQGLSALVLEVGSGVGGTWFWNRYPGARCDVESIDYSYSFDDELQQEWRWRERYASQPEILSYINHVAERFALLPDVRLNTRVAAADYDGAENLWRLEAEDGERFAAPFLISAVGCLSAPNVPFFPGLDSFRGEVYQTARWPHEGVEMKGRRVAVVGTGSTGVQAIPLLAEQAEHVYVFQRTPNFSMPARNAPLDEGTVDEVMLTYDRRRDAARAGAWGVPVLKQIKPYGEYDDRERTEILESGWREGGASGALRAFSDILTNEEANQRVADFVRSKIRATVSDPGLADRLIPTDYPIGAKRLCVDTNYYETYNRETVTLVDVRGDPIEAITENGLRTTAAEYEVDTIVFALGFDAITGALLAIDIRGRDGESLRDHWADGPRSYLGLGVSGFPNLLTITGPGSPSVLGNVIVSIEQHVEWIANCLVAMRARGCDRIEATAEAEREWSEHVREVAEKTLFVKAKSWFAGSNIEGKPQGFMPYAGGVPGYRAICDEVVADDYRGFELSSS
jgi:cation diffusion facilitator CzcD-associated flavoprotein CzcO